VGVGHVSGSAGSPRVLVTGASGFLGAHVVAALHRRSARVRVLVHNTPVDRDSVEVAYGDVCDASTMSAALAEVDVLVHAAGLASMAFVPWRAYERVNIAAPVALARAAERAGVKRFVHVSSVFACGPSASKVFDESDFMAGRETKSAYQRSKRRGVVALRTAGFQRLELSLAHPAALVGPGARSSGNWFRGLAEGLVQRSLAAVPSPSRARICLADVRDVAEGIASMVFHDRPGEWILGGENVPMARLLEMAHAEFGFGPRQLPAWLLYALARGLERPLHCLGRPLPAGSDFVEVMRHDWAFSSARAGRDLGFKARDVGPSLIKELRRAKSLKDGGGAAVESREA